MTALTHAEAVLSLLDGPPLATFGPGDLQAEVIELLGDDDPLAVALVIEEATQRAGEQIKANAIVEAELEPCRLESPCAGNEPLSGTGRCMTCGAQRRAIQPEADDRGICGACMGSGVSGPEPSQICPVCTGSGAERPERSDTEAPQAPVSTTEEMPATSAAKAAGEPLTGRVKEALGLPDKDMAHLLGVARPTAQAYASGRLPEIIDGVRAEYLLRAVKKRLAALEALRSELQTIVSVSD